MKKENTMNCGMHKHNIITKSIKQAKQIIIYKITYSVIIYECDTKNNDYKDKEVDFHEPAIEYLTSR